MATEFALNDTPQKNHDNDEPMEDIAEDLRRAKAMTTVMLLHTDFSILSPATLHDYFDELDSLITVAESQFECLQ